LSETLAKAGTIADQAERSKLYMEAEKSIGENVDRVFIAHTQVPLIFRADVKGYVPNPTAGELYRYVTVATK
jgi:ABC-type transport system substrate-binding protein